MVPNINIDIRWKVAAKYSLFSVSQHIYFCTNVYVPQHIYVVPTIGNRNTWKWLFRSVKTSWNTSLSSLVAAKNLDQLYSPIYPLYDLVDHTNHIFSESSWHPLSTDPLPTHQSPTQTHWSWWCTAGVDALQVVMRCRWWCTEGGDALKLMMN